MIKRFALIFTLLGLFCSPFSRMAYAQDDEPLIYYTDEEDPYFNRGTIVGIESDEIRRARNRVRNRNWAIALGSVAIGVATSILVNDQHTKRQDARHVKRHPHAK